jgi:hypothetical protein
MVRNTCSRRESEFPRPTGRNRRRRRVELHHQLLLRPTSQHNFRTRIEANLRLTSALCRSICSASSAHGTCSPRLARASPMKQRRRAAWSRCLIAPLMGGASPSVSPAVGAVKPRHVHGHPGAYRFHATTEELAVPVAFAPGRGTCGCQLFESPQAACAYSWISPPSRSRRTILAGGAKATGTAGPSGGACPKARCGRWPL